VVGFVIWQVHLQHFDASVDLLDQSRLPRQSMHRTDPASVQAARPLAQLVVDIACREHRIRLSGPVHLPKTLLNSALAIPQSLVV
jgi:hypothetical protein